MVLQYSTARRLNLYNLPTSHNTTPRCARLSPPSITPSADTTPTSTTNRTHRRLKPIRFHNRSLNTHNPYHRKHHPNPRTLHRPINRPNHHAAIPRNHDLPNPNPHFIAVVPTINAEQHNRDDIDTEIRAIRTKRRTGRTSKKNEDDGRNSKNPA